MEVDIDIVRNGSLRNNVGFEKEVISHFNNKASENVCATMAGFFQKNVVVTSMTNWAQIFPGLFISRIMLGYTKVRIEVSDKLPKVSINLVTVNSCKTTYIKYFPK